MTHVLVIDDETAVRAFIRQTLEAEGYQVSEATDGEEGLTALQTTSADLIITDIFMPNKEGIETIWTVHKQFPQIKILAISGGGKHKLTHSLPEALQFGAHHTLAKPFTPNELAEAVAATLHG